MARSWLWMGFAVCLAGCPELPVFSSIEDVTLRQGSSRGLSDRAVSRREKDRIKDCLAKTTPAEAPAGQDVVPLDKPYLLLVTDRGQVKSFEQYTAVYLRGNKGRYFKNTCLHAILTSLD